MSSILVMTVDTLIKELEEKRDLHGGDTEVELENFNTTTTTATEELLKNGPVVEESGKVKVILAEKAPGEINLTSVKELNWTW